MNLYELPKFNFPKFSKRINPLLHPSLRFGFLRNRTFWLAILIVFLSSSFGFLAGMVSGSIFYSQLKDELFGLNIEIPEDKTMGEEVKPSSSEKEYLPQTTQEEKIIEAVKKVSPAVVSIVITRYVEELYFTPFEETPLEKRIEEREVGGGTGFIISGEGMILTNKHVVLDEKADYTVLTNDGRKFPAKVLARDPVQDLAVIKIEGTNLPVVEFGDSEKLQIGQTVIAIGNVLGEFQNTVSVGVISGLGRTITAYGSGLYQTLEDVIQTDAAINRGNSGGPLLNLKGEVVGINTATVVGGENIGFAIPANKAKKGIEQVKTLGKIVYPFLGVRYVLITEKIQKENNLPIDYGAWVIKGDEGEPAITLGSAAEKAGLKENDIILELDGERITVENSLAKIIMKHNPGDSVVLRILRNGGIKTVQVVLGQRE